MKVASIYSVNFKGNQHVPSNCNENISKPQIDSLNKVTPDFGVKVPQSYTKTNVHKLDNGLEIYTYKLANGYKLSVVPMEGSPAVVKTYVNVGSMNETPDIKGISHFLEHMAFNGTNGDEGHIKLETGDSFKKIDELGGWTNASTNYAITDYVNSTPLLENKDLETQIKVLSAMTEDLKLSDAMITKEKGPVCSEINMIMDNPQTIALDQTVRTLFNIKNPADELVGGSVKHIQNLTRKDVMDYYNKYYTPNNINIVITGDVNPDEAAKLVSKNFVSKKIGQGKRYEEKITPISHTIRKDFKSDKAKSTEIVIGFAGPKNKASRERVIYDLALEYMNDFESGLTKNLKPYNTHPYIDWEKISTNPNANRLTYIAMSTSEKNTEKVLNELFSTIKQHKPIEQKTLNRLKEKLQKLQDESFEYSISVNGRIGNAVLNDNLEYITNYTKYLDSITADELNQAINKYFDLNKAAITVVHPQNNEIVFKGKQTQNSRLPIDETKAYELTLDNNYNLGFYETKSNNIEYELELSAKKPYTQKAGVTNILHEIYSMGTKNMAEDELNKFKADNNINVCVFAGNDGICASYSGNNKNYELGIRLANEILNNPRLTEENLQKAKERIRDSIERAEDTAHSVYNEYDSKTNPYRISNIEILKNLDSITLEDVRKCHKYLLESSSANLKVNIPQNCKEVKDFVIEETAKLNNVQPKTFETLNIYRENKKPVILTKAKKNSQADIKQIYHYKFDDTIKDIVVGNLMNSILTNSSIGLFDTLREKEHLAYSVYSDNYHTEDRGEISLNILTTTDNKDIGEISYDNLQKSIDGFNRQINELKSGNFTEQDLESAKKVLKANFLQKEGVSSKLHALKMNSKHGIFAENDAYRIIDNITKEDITEYAKKVFAQKPIISIVATQDTLDANKEYLNKLAD